MDSKIILAYHCAASLRHHTTRGCPHLVGCKYMMSNDRLSCNKAENRFSYSFPFSSKAYVHLAWVKHLTKDCFSNPIHRGSSKEFPFILMYFPSQYYLMIAQAVREILSYLRLKELQQSASKPIIGVQLNSMIFLSQPLTGQMYILLYIQFQRQAETCNCRLSSSSCRFL